MRRRGRLSGGGGAQFAQVRDWGRGLTGACARTHHSSRAVCPRVMHLKGAIKGLRIRHRQVANRLFAVLRVRAKDGGGRGVHDGGHSRTLGLQRLRSLEDVERADNIHARTEHRVCLARRHLQRRKMNDTVGGEIHLRKRTRGASKMQANW